MTKETTIRKSRAGLLVLAALLAASPALPAFALTPAQSQNAPSQNTDTNGVPVQSSDQMKADQQALKESSKDAKKQSKAEKKAAKEKAKAAKQAAKAEQHQDKAASELQKGNTPQQ
jgi:hypothetical protein